MTLLYLLPSTEILITNYVVQYNLRKYSVVINGTLRNIIVSSCTALGINNYLCYAKLHPRDIHRKNDSSYWLFKFKIFNKIFCNYNRFRI